MFGFLFDLLLRLSPNEVVQTVKAGESGKIQLVASRGHYGLFFDDYRGHKKWIWLTDPLERSQWRAVFSDAQTDGSSSRSLGTPKKMITGQCDGNTFALSIGDCVIAFDASIKEELKNLLDGLVIK